MSPHDRVRATAPGKIIISGEHAVLYGASAIAAALSACAITTISRVPTSEQREKKTLSIRLRDMKTTISGSVAMFSRVKDRLFHSYKKFLVGKKSLRQLLAHPTELFQFATGTLIDACYLELKESVDIELSSSIPIGCGMGSSAATIVSFLRALTHYFQITYGAEWLQKAALEIERLQHGRSSGLDTFVSLHGGAVLFGMDKPPSFLGKGPIDFLKSLPFWVVETGKPDSSTGECVDAVRKRFQGASSSIWSEFSSLTNEVVQVLEKKNMQKLMDLLSQNHTLLTYLGVVPKKVSSFVQKAKEMGISLKTSGAGAVRGDGGGILLGLGPTPPKSLLEEYGYTLRGSIYLASSGAEVV